MNFQEEDEDGEAVTVVGLEEALGSDSDDSETGPGDEFGSELPIERAARKEAAVAVREKEEDEAEMQLNIAQDAIYELPQPGEEEEEQQMSDLPTLKARINDVLQVSPSPSRELD